jgi:2-methylcitrate dehydratase
MTLVEEMAEFVSSSSYDRLSKAAVLQLKIRVLDAIGCAIGALSSEPVAKIRALQESFGGSRQCTLVGGGKTSPERAALKRYNAEVHSQSSIECMLARKSESGFRVEDIKSVELRIFDVAYNIIGGGEEGDKKLVETKEQADHSLPYILAAAVLDGQVMLRQYSPRRIARDDVQSLLRKIDVHPDEQLSSRFPEVMPCRITVRLNDGRSLEKSADDYEGFFTRPMGWERAAEKFHGLASSHASLSLRRKIEDAVKHLDQVEIRDLANLLGRVGRTKRS